MDLIDLNLADFALGDDEDLTSVTPDFLEWRAALPQYHELFSRPFVEGAKTRSKVQADGRIIPVINLASQDYLGMSEDRHVAQAQIDALQTWGNGAGGTPLVCGLNTFQTQLEDEMKALSQKDGALIYSSAYASALGCCSGLLRRGDIAILDEKTHICWHEGVRMAGARVVTFQHNDPEDLARVLEGRDGTRKVVIVDGLYSMDGDFARLEEILEVCDSKSVPLIVDEAHSIFADGPTGGGMTERLGLLDRVAVFMGTFSKAAGLIGGFLCADKDLIDYIRYYSKPYAFSCALPPSTMAGLVKSVQIIRGATDLRENLLRNAERFRDGVHSMGLDTGFSESWVVPVIVGSDRGFLLEATRQLMLNGLFVAPIEFPAVPPDKLRMRFAPNARHTVEDIDEALGLIETFVAKPLRSSPS